MSASSGQTIRCAFGLEIIANDYIVLPDGSKHLLEVNHIPNATRFPDMWEAYRDFVIEWVSGQWSYLSPSSDTRRAPTP